MRINRSDRPGTSGAAKPAKQANRDAGAFQLTAPEGARNTQMASGPKALGGVDGLLAIQEVPDTSGRAKRAVKRGTDMLDLLDDLKMGLLVGVIPLSKLRQLLVTVEKQRDDVSDPELGKILDEIDLRARVELAKLGKIAA